jgi:predicted permease
MPIYLKFAFFQCAIIIPFIAGCALRTRLASPQELSRSLVRVNIFCLEPLIVLWCTWGLTMSAELMVLPVFGLGLVAAGVLAGSVAATFLKLEGPRRKSFLISTSLANHGFTMGGALCYFFFGEKGLGYSVILVLYFIPYVYCLVFPYSKAGTGGRIFPRGELKKIIFTLQNMPLFAMAAGLLLSSTGISRPDIAFPVDWLLLCSVSLYYFTLGITFTGVDIGGTRRELAALSVIKFIILPGAAFMLLSLLPLDSAVKGVIQMQACMPAAIYSVVTAVLFDQDSDLASSLFVSSTVIFLVGVLPVIFLLS